MDLAEARPVEPETVRTRRALQQSPELSHHEATVKLVTEKLEPLGTDVKRGVGGTRVAETQGRAVSLRADVDALPLEEPSDVEFRSKAEVDEDVLKLDAAFLATPAMGSTDPGGP
jgi:metal-dependent amidase/aminoacylase/carboxypeptidase family protein